MFFAKIAEMKYLQKWHCFVSYTGDMEYSKCLHQFPTHTSYKHIWTSEKADVSVLQKMRAANLNQSFKTPILSQWKPLQHHSRQHMEMKDGTSVIWS